MEDYTDEQLKKFPEIKRKLFIDGGFKFGEESVVEEMKELKKLAADLDKKRIIANDKITYNVINKDCKKEADWILKNGKLSFDKDEGFLINLDNKSPDITEDEESTKLEEFFTCVDNDHYTEVADLFQNHLFPEMNKTFNENNRCLFKCTHNQYNTPKEVVYPCMASCYKMTADRALVIYRHVNKRMDEINSRL